MSARGMSGSRRATTKAPSTRLATPSRPSASAPAEMSSPASRMPTKALAHSTTVVTPAAKAGSSARRVASTCALMRVQRARVAIS